jgi:hypothetical protein
MADKHTRHIPLEDKVLFDLVTEKGQIVEKGRAIAVEMEEVSKQFDAVKAKHDIQFDKLHKIKLKIIKRVQKVAAKELGEFEVPVTTDIKDGKLTLEISDSLAEFKESFKTFDRFTHAAPTKSK